MPISIPTSIAGISVPGAVNGPLNALYGNKYSLGKYNYPRDLSTNPTRKHVILFTVNRVDPSKNIAVTDQDLKGLTNIKSASDALNAASNFASGALGVAGNVLDQVRNGQSTEAISASLPGGLTDSINKVFATKVGRYTASSIAMYVPESVQVQYDVKYQSDIGLSDALGTAYYLAQGATSLYDTAVGQGDTASSYINKAGNNPFVRDKLGKFVGSIAQAAGGNAQEVRELALQAGGYAFNPQLQVLFQGIGFRTFQFDFTLTPYSQEEAKEIQDIIYQFKYASAPEIKKNGWFDQGMYMTIPDTFNIQFMYDGKENPSVHKVGECVLTNITVDSSPNGWATFNDGSPVQYKLKLQFQEIMVVDKTRISEGY